MYFVGLFKDTNRENLIQGMSGKVLKVWKTEKETVNQ